MATNEQLVIDALKPLHDENTTTSALRVLAFTAVHEATAALRKGDYEAVQRAAYALMHTAEVLEQRERCAGAKPQRVGVSDNNVNDVNGNGP